VGSTQLRRRAGTSWRGSEVEAGHRTLSHTADVIIEAWAPTRDACLAQAVRALVDTFADTSPVSVTRPVPLRILTGEDTELLVALLEEVVYLVDVLAVVPVDAVVHAVDGGGIGGCLDVALLAEVNIVGPAPKGIARSELAIEGGDGLWRCRAIVDV
jgi:SHS2 domain-containing protein